MFNKQLSRGSSDLHVCQFPWCKCSYHSHFQATNVRLQNRVRGRSAQLGLRTASQPRGCCQTPLLLWVSGKLGFDLDTFFNKMIKEAIICEADNLDLQGVVTHLVLPFFLQLFETFPDAMIG